MWGGHASGPAARCAQLPAAASASAAGAAATVFGDGGDGGDGCGAGAVETAGLRATAGGVEASTAAGAITGDEGGVFFPCAPAHG